MRYLKYFESLDPELEEVKSFMIELAQDWDIYWVDEIDFFDESQWGEFIYTVRYIEGNFDWNILIDIYLPYFLGDVEKFLSDVRNVQSRLKTIYDQVEVRDFNFDNKYDSAPQIQIVIS